MLTHKYRPKYFSDFVGFADKVEIATSQLESGNIFIFCGPAGSGRSSFAEVFSKSILCSYTKIKEPCGQCLSCSSFSSGNNPAFKNAHSSYFTSPDIFNSFIFEDSDIKRAVIIQDADSISEDMQSSIGSLSKNTIFILCCQSTHHLTDNLISRASVLYFDYPSQDDIVHILKKVSSLENISFQESFIQRVAEEGKNVPRSLNHLEHISYFGEINSENTLRVLHKEERTFCKEIFSNIANPRVLKDLCTKFSEKYSVNKVYLLLSEYLVDAYCLDGFDDTLKFKYGKELLKFSKFLTKSSHQANHITEVICDLLLLEIESPVKEVPRVVVPTDSAIIEKTNSRVLMQRQLMKKPSKKSEEKYTALMLSNRLGIPCQRESG